MSLITEKDLEEARKILGDTAKDWTDEQLKDELVKMNFLVESWMDEYERSIFDGKTLAEKVPGVNTIFTDDEDLK